MYSNMGIIPAKNENDTLDLLWDNSVKNSEFKNNKIIIKDKLN